MTAAAIATELAPPRCRPVIFQGDNVVKIMNGTKTQTRRIEALRDFGPSDTDGYEWQFRDAGGVWRDITHAKLLASSRYGVPGDRLWVKETFAVLHFAKDPETGIVDDWKQAKSIPTDSDDGYWKVVYPTDRWVKDVGRERNWRWRSSIHMPRWCSRLELEVTDLRIQQLHDISEDDAKAEGVQPFFERFPGIGRDQVIIWKRSEGWNRAYDHLRGDIPELARDFPYRASYACLWDEINGDRCLWNKNPWVWAVTFNRITNP